MSTQPLLSVRQAAALLGLSPDSVYQLCARRRLRHQRLGPGAGKIRIPESALAEYLKACEVPADGGDDGGSVYGARVGEGRRPSPGKPQSAPLCPDGKPFKFIKIQ